MPEAEAAPKEAPPAPKRKRVGWIWYAATLVAVLGMSWGGPLFALLGKATPPFMKAGWRLQLMVLAMAPLAIWQWREASPELRLRWRSKLPVLAINGAVFAAHLCSFAWAIDHTSFSHAMLIVGTLPMLLVTWAALLYLAYKASTAPQGSSDSEGVEDTTSNSGGGAGLAASDAQAAVDTAALTASSTAAPPPPAPVPGAVTESVAPPSPPLKTHVSLSSAGRAGVARRRTGSASLAGGESGVAVVLEEPEPLPLPPPATAPVAGGASTVTTSLESAAAGAPAAPETSLQRFVRFARGGDPSPPLPPTRQEVIGSLVAFTGLALLVFNKAGSDESGAGAPTVAGDLTALLTALTMAVYVLVGQSIRRWMPTWMYAAPLMASSCVTTIILSLLFEEGTSFFSAGPRGAFGYWGTGRDLGITTVAAVVPGILGHGIANLALARVNPLVLSVVQLIQPGISVLEGSAIGVQNSLPAGVFASAPIIFIGIFLVVTGSRNAPKTKGGALRRIALAAAGVVPMPCLKRKGGNVAAAVARALSQSKADALP